MISANSGCSGYATRSLAPRLIFLALCGTSTAAAAAAAAANANLLLVVIGMSLSNTAMR
mgnify:FL=1